VRADMILHDRP